MGGGYTECVRLERPPPSRRRTLVPKTGEYSGHYNPAPTPYPKRSSPDQTGYHRVWWAPEAGAVAVEANQAHHRLETAVFRPGEAAGGDWVAFAER